MCSSFLIFVGYFTGNIQWNVFLWILKTIQNSYWYFQPLWTAVFYLHIMKFWSFQILFIHFRSNNQWEWNKSYNKFKKRFLEHNLNQVSVRHFYFMVTNLKDSWIFSKFASNINIIFNFEHISHLFLVSLLLNMDKFFFTWKKLVFLPVIHTKRG